MKKVLTVTMDGIRSMLPARQIAGTASSGRTERRAAFSAKRTATI